MRYKYLTAIGILTTIFGLANSVSAQSPVTTNAEDVTLSGESLTGIEQRTLRDDFDQFFLNDPTIAWRGTGGNQIEFNNQVGGDWQVMEDVEISINEPFSPPISPINFRRHENLSSGIDRVEVQVELD
ncbi:MAG: hypothetical protein RID09_18535 [Coleofasciculus sp. G1-WW12-02]|uniref:hypothetical protein n=1 Tax=Coleofasciculus sp. G1-WW12-02 TaxID=3068483 RepID=UPI0032F3CFF9